MFLLTFPYIGRFGLIPASGSFAASAFPDSALTPSLWKQKPSLLRAPENGAEKADIFMSFIKRSTGSAFGMRAARKSCRQEACGRSEALAGEACRNARGDHQSCK
jgi:hypothetical protein